MRPYRGKRALDLTVVALAAVPSCLAAAIVAIAIVFDDGRPVFFRQERVGQDGQRFRVWKFRTMTHGVAPNPLFPDESRITRVGRVLRRSSLDELPQLINVALGDMSIVGPRPTLAYQVERYDERQRGRLSVRPGLTGLAQIRGRNELPWAQRIELDLEYIERQSITGDLRLMLESILVVARGSGVSGHPANDPLARVDRDQTAP